jgi:ATP-dependent exoDNAse (exonuclease V) alpha subunit
MNRTKNIVLNAEQKNAVEKIAAGKNVCLLGMAGTGKSAVINETRRKLKAMGKVVKTVSYQGLAAQIIGGSTIHRLFKFPWDLASVKPSKTNVLNLIDVDVLIIDEIGMVSENLMTKMFDCLSFLEKPIQIVVVGDFYQIEPFRNYKKKSASGKRYAFQSYYWDTLNFEICTLTKVVRQGDWDYIYNLYKLSRGDRSVLSYFVKNMNPYLIEDAIFICTHNEDARRINNAKLNALKGEKSQPFMASYEGKIDFNELPGERCLVVKKGLRVMATVNTNYYVNGEMGTVVDFENHKNITVKFDNCDEEITVLWHYTKMDRIDDGSEGEVTDVRYMPLRPAYAISIHKSQGQTFDKVNIVINDKKNGTWAHGQLYVALSRGRSLENTHIRGNIFCCRTDPDKEVDEFYKSIGYPGIEKPRPAA